MPAEGYNYKGYIFNCMKEDELYSYSSLFAYFGTGIGMYAI